MRSRILFISGHQDDARRLSRMLYALPLAHGPRGNGGGRARPASRGTTTMSFSRKPPYPMEEWLDVLHLAREYPREVEVIVTDPQADARFWAEALNLGAYDLLAQPFYEPEVRRILYNACSRPACQSRFRSRRMAAV